MNTVFIKKIAGYFWPVTKKIHSDINGVLEVTWYQGKKMLDTKNANFSYGSLDIILDEAFKYITVNPDDDVLILGLGGGNFIKKIRKDFLHKGKITAVEFDREIIRIAKEEFDIQTNEKLKIHYQDAAKFVQETKNTYDFIFVDIFVDNIVPEIFYGISFWDSIYTLLNPSGKFLFNAGIDIEETTKIKDLMHFLNTKMKVFKKESINQTNTLLFGEKS